MPKGKGKKSVGKLMNFVLIDKTDVQKTNHRISKTTFNAITGKRENKRVNSFE